MKNIFFTIVFFSINLLLHSQSINSSQSIVNFKVSNMKVNTVEGTFSGMNGTINFGEQTPAKMNVCIDAASVKTDSEQRDEHLRNEDFFHVSKYPKICFESQKIYKTGNDYYVDGSLTLLQTSKKVTIPFSYQNHTLQGTFTIKRSDFKLAPKTNKFMVGDDVEIQIICKINMD